MIVEPRVSGNKSGHLTDRKIFERSIPHVIVVYYVKTCVPASINFFVNVFIATEL